MLDKVRLSIIITAMGSPARTAEQRTEDQLALYVTTSTLINEARGRMRMNRGLGRALLNLYTGALPADVREITNQPIIFDSRRVLQEVESTADEDGCQGVEWKRYIGSRKRKRFDTEKIKLTTRKNEGEGSEYGHFHYSLIPFGTGTEEVVLNNSPEAEERIRAFLAST